MIKEADIVSIEKHTGKSWIEWLEFFESMEASGLSHAEIARAAQNQMNIEKAGWWSQSVAVAYEQHIGRRKPGQRSDGSFEANVSKTITGARDDVFSELLTVLAGVKDFHGKSMDNVRISITPVRSYWRCDVDNAGRVTFSVEEKANEKVLVVINHAGIASSAESAEWRDFWKAYFEEGVLNGE